MIWEKKGLIYNVNKASDWNFSHCHKPTPLLVDNDLLRVYIGVRSNISQTRTTFVDLDISDLENIKVDYVHDKPVIDLGKIGAFDDSGANVCSIVKLEDGKVMYFIGWNPSTTVHTRNSIGLAVSHDNGLTFERMYDGAVLDRTKDEPYYTGAVDVMKSGDKWKMWYTCGREWKMINGKPEIQYYIKYAESENGIDWERNNVDCILPENDLEAVARPSVFFDGESYKMWYSRRSIAQFRTVGDNGYRGGYAESADGENWIRKDDEFGVDISDSGWDSKAVAYPYVIKIKDRLLMLYNGNGFGQSGFGYALSNIE